MVCRPKSDRDCNLFRKCHPQNFSWKLNLLRKIALFDFCFVLLIHSNVQRNVFFIVDVCITQARHHIILRFVKKNGFRWVEHTLSDVKWMERVDYTIQSYSIQWWYFVERWRVEAWNDKHFESPKFQ